MYRAIRRTDDFFTITRGVQIATCTSDGTSIQRLHVLHCTVNLE